jgi:hypothetical protein
MKTWISASLVAGCVLASVGPAAAAEPTQADFDACNRMARAAGANPSASPREGGTTTGPAITTPSGTPDSTQGVQPGGTGGKTGPMITGTGREPGSPGGVSQGTGAVSRDSTAGGSTSSSGASTSGAAGGTSAGSASAGRASAGEIRGMADTGNTNPVYKTAYQDCMKQRGY